MRIKNVEQLLSHGNIAGRTDVLKIINAALAAADPYYNAARLMRLEGDTLYVGRPEFEISDDPRKGEMALDINAFEHIYVVGAGKGVQRVALAFEEALGDRLTGGHVVAKHGDELLLTRIGVTYGAHPIPDENCAVGCRRILDYAGKVNERDLVITIIANGASSLLTLPVEGVTIEDVRALTHLMQIEKGVITNSLNVVRSHIDQLKGGKLARVFREAKLIHVAVADANQHSTEFVQNYEQSLKNNRWLHNLPEHTTYEMAVNILRENGAWEACPENIRTCLLKADPQYETVKFEEYHNMNFRIFGIMPKTTHYMEAAKQKARELGYDAHLLADFLVAEASQAAQVYGAIAAFVESKSQPFAPPAVLLSTGEMIVTVGDSRCVGGRNQEFSLAAARRIAGSRGIVIGSVDTDGTDGPGGLTLPGAPRCLAGGLVDGYTAGEAAGKGIDIARAIRRHATSEALWQLDCGIHLEQNISLNDLTVMLIK